MHQSTFRVNFSAFKPRAAQHFRKEAKLASFIVRIELHSATYSDYDQLHHAMDSVGFSRVIKGDDGFWYHLPDAEYEYSGNATLAQVYDAAAGAASSTGRSHGILVTEYVRAQWLLRRVVAKTA